MTGPDGSDETVSDTSDTTTGPSATESALLRTSRGRWQVGLRTLFLLVIACAVWITHFNDRRDIATLEKRIATLHPLARELEVADPSRIAVVKMDELWYDENKWELYLPPGRYRVCLATREVDNHGFAPVVKSAAIGAGRHRLALDETEVDPGSRVVVTSDGAELLAVDEPRGWDDHSGSTGGGEHSISTQFPADGPVVLFRRRFSKKTPEGNGGYTSSTPNGPTEGILLWIEPEAGPKAGP